MLNIFPLVETLDFPEHPAEHGIVYDVIMAAPDSHEPGIYGRFPRPIWHEGGGNYQGRKAVTMFISMELTAENFASLNFEVVRIGKCGSRGSRFLSTLSDHTKYRCRYPANPGQKLI